jgi:hypothetical protein
MVIKFPKGESKGLLCLSPFYEGLALALSKPFRILGYIKEEDKGMPEV